MTKAMGYIRVSTRYQSEKGGGLEEQLMQIKAYCDAHKLGEPVVKVDICSGRVEPAKREGLGAALLELSEAPYTHFIVPRIDRLSRESVQAETLIAYIETSGLEFCSADPKESFADGSDPVRKMVRQIIGIFAEYERSIITARLIAGRRAKIRSGGYAGGVVPFGYKIEGEGRDSRIVPGPDWAWIVQMKEWHDSGVSMLQIAKRLDEANVPRVRGGRWTSQAVKRSLERLDPLGDSVVA